MKKILKINELSFDNEPFIVETDIKGLLIVKRPYYGDERGSFQELARVNAINELSRDRLNIKQISITQMLPGSLKGIHAERQSKLLMPLFGKIVFCEVDLRPDSGTYKQWLMIETDMNNVKERCAIFVPNGIGNSICTLEAGKENEYAELIYAVTEEYNPEEAKRVVRWDDPDLGIPWPIKDPVVSERDKTGFLLKDFEKKYLELR